jgi:hypothetical protein
MMSLRTAIGEKNFKTRIRIHFFIIIYCTVSPPSGVAIATHNRACMQFADSTDKMFQRVTDNLLQQL